MKRSMMLALSWGTFAITPLRAPDLPPQQLPVYGGSSGTAFTRSCGSGYVLTGFRYRIGIWVDAVGIMCRQVKSDGTLGSETTVGTMAGGGAGTLGTTSCPAGSVVAIATVAYGMLVNGFHFRCHVWDAASRKWTSERVQLAFGRYLIDTQTVSRCEDKSQPVHAIRGRVGWFVDAIGIVCDEP